MRIHQVTALDPARLDDSRRGLLLRRRVTGKIGLTKIGHTEGSDDTTNCRIRLTLAEPTAQRLHEIAQARRESGTESQ